jgi:ketosteroid isomerase-like protein
MNTRRPLWVVISGLAVALTLSLAGCGQSGAGGSGGASGSAATASAAAPASPIASASIDEQENAAILAVINANIDAMNSEDIDAYMACLDPSSPLYDSTRSQVETIFEQYDLQTEVTDLYVTDASATVAHVHAVITTTKISGPEFADNRLTAVFELHKVDGAWKIYGQTISDVEYL